MWLMSLFYETLISAILYIHKFQVKYITMVPNHDFVSVKHQSIVLNLPDDIILTWRVYKHIPLVIQAVIPGSSSKC